MAFWLESRWGGLHSSGCRPPDDLSPCVQTSVEVALTRSHIVCIFEKESSRAPCPVEVVEVLLDHDRPGADIDVLGVALAVP